MTSVRIIVDATCTVRLLRGYPQPLTYRIPAHLAHNVKPGTVVLVPLQKRVERALVLAVDVQYAPEVAAYALRDVQAIEELPHDDHYARYIAQLSEYYAIHPAALYRRIHEPAPLRKKRPVEEVERDAMGDVVPERFTLTHEQRAAVEAIIPTIRNPHFQPYVLHGVTGSGKTAVYGELVREALVAGCSVIIMVPEVALAMSFAAIFRAWIPHDAQLYEYHVLISTQQRRAVWKALHVKAPMVLVGVHLPILLPLGNVRCIIVDEEHDQGYQEKNHPRIHSRDAALLRAREYNIPVVLGSATPSMHTLHCVQQGSWKLLELHHRFQGSFPEIKHVTISSQKRTTAARDSFWISRELRDAIVQRLACKEQTIVFLNRRGLHRMVHCGRCSHQYQCGACSVSLVLHDDAYMRCHYCSASVALPERCVSCGGDASELVTRGVGTQRIAALLASMFPGATVARADADSRSATSWRTTLDGMRNGSIDILVGTQTITKGYHFPRVTLVGILWAESLLSMPSYASAEHTVQQLVQVAGRAGRATDHGLVIVQSFTNQPLFAYLSEARYRDFYAYEVAHRAELGYPPLVRLSEIQFASANAVQVEAEAARAVQLMRACVDRHRLPVAILGPALPPVHKIAGVHGRTIHIKGGSLRIHRALYAEVQRHEWRSRHFFTPNAAG